MDKLKVEMLMMGRDIGDTGDNETQRAWIEIFFEALKTYLTPEGIESFTALQLRVALIHFTKVFNTNEDMQEAINSLPALFHIREYPRDKPLQLPVSSDSVVDIFSARS